MPTVTEVEVLVGMVEMRDPVTPSGTTAKQVVVEVLLSLDSSKYASGSRDLILSPGATACLTAAPAMLLVAESPF